MVKNNNLLEFASQISLGLEKYEKKFEDILVNLENSSETIKLTDYQKFTSSYFLMENVRSMLLFWETGFGKTIECVYIMKNIFEIYPQWKIFLFVKSSLTNDPWLMTIKKFLPKEKSQHILIINYDLEIQNYFLTQYSSIPKSYRIFFVFDEAHDFIKKLVPKENMPDRRLKGISKKLIEGMSRKFNKTLFMSATPVTDNSLEFNIMMNFLRHGNIKLNQELFRNKNLIAPELLKQSCLGVASFKRRSDIDAFKETNPTEELAGKKINFIDIYMSDFQTKHYASACKQELGSRSRGFRILRKLANLLAFGDANIKKTDDPDALNRLIAERQEAFKRMLERIKFSREFIEEFKTGNLKINKENSFSKNLGIKIDNSISLASTLDFEEARKYKFARELRNLEELHSYSSIYIKTIQLILQSKGKCIVFQPFVSFEGIKTFIDYFTKFNITFIEYSEKTRVNRSDLVAEFNNSDNMYGEKIKVCILSQAGVEGISFKYITDVVITSQLWSGYEQIFGRAIRLNSHKDWPLEDKYVNFHILINHPNSGNYKSVDVEILDIVKRKAHQSNQLYNVLKDVSIETIHNMYPNAPAAEKEDFNYLTNIPYNIKEYENNNISVIKEFIPIKYTYMIDYSEIFSGYLDEETNHVYNEDVIVGSLKIDKNRKIFKIIDNELVYLIVIL